MPCSITFSEVNVHFLCLHGVYGNKSDNYVPFQVQQKCKFWFYQNNTKSLAPNTCKCTGSLKATHINGRQVRIQRGGQGVRTPPGKSQVIWVSIGNKQLDPPWEKLDPPGKCWTPLEP